MKIESVDIANAAARSIRYFSENPRVKKEQSFHKSDQNSVDNLSASEPGEKKVAPSDILNKIKEISQDGLYSIRFEKNDNLDEFVVKVVDRETEEVIRQIPPEEILGVKAKMQEFTGNIVRSEG